MARPEPGKKKTGTDSNEGEQAMRGAAGKHLAGSSALHWKTTFDRGKARGSTGFWKASDGIMSEAWGPAAHSLNKGAQR